MCLRNTYLGLGARHEGQIRARRMRACVSRNFAEEAARTKKYSAIQLLFQLVPTARWRFEMKTPVTKMLLGTSAALAMLIAAEAAYAQDFSLARSCLRPATPCCARGLRRPGQSKLWIRSTRHRRPGRRRLRQPSDRPRSRPIHSRRDSAPLRLGLARLIANRSRTSPAIGRALCVCRPSGRGIDRGGAF